MITDIRSASDPRELCDAIYRGEILRFGGFDAVSSLITYTRKYCELALSPLHPTRADKAESAIAELGPLHKRYNTDPQAQQYWRNVFRDIGFDLTDTAVDRLFLRFQIVQSPGKTQSELRTGPLPPHRDTWGSNLYAQINWWAPVYPVSPQNTLALFPRYWNEPVRNTSATFDLKQAIQINRKAGQSKPKVSDIIPLPTQSIDADGAYPVLIEPGELIAFSGAHLHASIPNTSELTRVSLETRTLCICDQSEGVGAPNIDGQSAWQSPGWFKRMSDRKSLGDILQKPGVCPFPAA